MILENVGDIPMVLCAGKDYTGPEHYYLTKQPIPLSERVPLAELSQSCNLTYLYANLYIHENVEMMFRTLPRMKRFIYVGDERFVNQVNSQEIQEILRTKHPDVHYTFLSSRDIKKTNQLIEFTQLCRSPDHGYSVFPVGSTNGSLPAT